MISRQKLKVTDGSSNNKGKDKIRRPSTHQALSVDPPAHVLDDQESICGEEESANELSQTRNVRSKKWSWCSDKDGIL